MDLQKIRDEVPRHDMRIILGDLNAQVGSENIGIEDTLGREGLGTRNDNGGRLVQFGRMNGMVIGGSIFPHREIHKLTWKSPRGYLTQIDHLLINRKWRRSLYDVRVLRSADSHSDHYLLLGKVQLKLAGRGKVKTTRGSWNRNLLKLDKVREKFVMGMENKFNLLRDLPEDADINHRWTQLKEMYGEVGEDCVGREKKSRPAPWMSQQTWELIQQRKEIHQKILGTRSRRVVARLENEYRRLDKEVKRYSRCDKRQQIEDLAQLAQDAADMGQMKKVYDVTRVLSGKKRKVAARLKDSDGKVIVDQVKQAKIWTNHFKEVLNAPAPDRPLEIEEATSQLPMDTEPPTSYEIKEIILSATNGKAPGIDELPAEFLKCNPESCAEALETLFAAIWRQEKIPDEWKKGLIVKLPKKGDLSKPSNWRGITLLPYVSKVFLKVLHHRIISSLEESKVIDEEQAGFRNGRSCTDHIFTLRNIVEQCEEWRVPLYVNFIDFRKAFDSVHRDTLWRVLGHYGVPAKLIKLTRIFYEGYQCKMQGNEQDDFFEVNSGVRQGCVISPLLFILATDYIMKSVQKTHTAGLRWNFTTKLNYLAYADDLALLSTTHRSMQRFTDELVETSGRAGLHLNQDKTKVLRVYRERMGQQQNDKFVADGKEIEFVDDFLYLGAKVDAVGGAAIDIQNRINNATTAYYRLSKVWRSTSLTHQLKFKLYQSNVLSVLLYGCETWRLTREDLARLEVFHMSCCRRILKVYWWTKTSNDEVFRRSKQRAIIEMIEVRRWRYLGHSLRRKDSIPNTSLSWAPEGSRRRGRPKETWRRTALKQLQGFNIKSWAEAGEIAKDRDRWRDYEKMILTQYSTRNSAP